MKTFHAQKWLIIMVCLLSAVTTHVTLGQEAETEQPIPEPVALINEQGYDLVNFLLLGSDTTNPQNSGRTDVILIVSVNRSTNTISMLSLPRDLYVYIPDWQFNRINTAYGHGESVLGDGGGVELLKQTIFYNLGIEIDFFARVDFNGFKQIIDSLGGVQISVDCAIQDWRLREPDLDVTVEENWELFTLPVGVHSMDGNLALWYVRSRRTSSDFDRGRRQQDMIRALWREIRDLGLFNQLPDIWSQVNEMVRTDVQLPDLVGLAPFALNLESSRITSHTFKLNEQVTGGYSPEGSSVLFLIPEGIRELGNEFINPPTASQIISSQVTVEIINGSGIGDLARVAADRLAWEGFTPTISPETAPYREYTSLVDFTGRTKGGSLEALRRVMRVGEEGVKSEPDANRLYDYQLTLGNRYYACTHDVLPPKQIETDSQ